MNVEYEYILNWICNNLLSRLYYKTFTELHIYVTIKLSICTLHATSWIVKIMHRQHQHCQQAGT